MEDKPRIRVHLLKGLSLSRETSGQADPWDGSSDVTGSRRLTQTGTTGDYLPALSFSRVTTSSRRA